MDETAAAATDPQAPEALEVQEAPELPQAPAFEHEQENNNKFGWVRLAPNVPERQRFGESLHSVTNMGTTHSWDAEEGGHKLWASGLTESRANHTPEKPEQHNLWKKKRTEKYSANNSFSGLPEKSGPHLLADAQSELEKLMEFHPSYLGCLDAEGCMQPPGLFSFAPQRYSFVGKGGLRYRRTETRELIEHNGVRFKGVFKRAQGPEGSVRDDASMHSFGQQQNLDPVLEDLREGAEYEESVIERFADSPGANFEANDVSARWKGDQSFLNHNTSLDGSFKGRLVFSRLKEDKNKGTLLIIEGGRLSSYKDQLVQFLGEGLPSAPTGIGHWTDRDGQYQGEFLDGLRQGWGVQTALENPILSRSMSPQMSKSMLWSKNMSSKTIPAVEMPVVRCGQWEGGVRDGPAKDTSPEETFYGFYKEGLRDGPAIIKSENSEFCGSFREGKRNGVGSFKSQNRTYIGEWQDDLPHGNGLERLTEETYFGGWVHGQRDGLGILYTSTAEADGYFGYFKAGDMHGLILPIRDSTVRKADAVLYENGVQTELLPLPSKIQDLFLRFPKFDMTKFITKILSTQPSLRKEAEAAKKTVEHHCERIESCLQMFKSEIEIEQTVLQQKKSELEEEYRRAWTEFQEYSKTHEYSVERALLGDFPTGIPEAPSEADASENFDEFEEYLSQLRSDQFKSRESTPEKRSSKKINILGKTESSKSQVYLKERDLDTTPPSTKRGKQDVDVGEQASKAEEGDGEITILVEEEPDDKATKPKPAGNPPRLKSYSQQRVESTGLSLLLEVHNSANPEGIVELLLEKTQEIEEQERLAEEQEALKKEQERLSREQLHENLSCPSSQEKIGISEAKDSRMEEDSAPSPDQKQGIGLLEYGRRRERSKSPGQGVVVEKTTMEKSRSELTKLKGMYRKISKQSPSKSLRVDRESSVERKIDAKIDIQSVDNIDPPISEPVLAADIPPGEPAN